MLERFTKRARLVVTQARQEARELGHPSIGTEHLLLALLSVKGSMAAGVLAAVGVSYDGVRADVGRLVRGGGLGAQDAAALEAIGIDLAAVRARLEESFGPGALDPPQPARRGLFRRGQPPERSPFNQRARKTLELALREALRLKHSYIGTEHLLLGIVREGEGLAAMVLTEQGVDLADLRRRIEEAVREAA